MSLAAHLLTAALQLTTAAAPDSIDAMLEKCKIPLPADCRGCVAETVTVGGAERLHVARGAGASAVGGWSWEHLLVDPQSCKAASLLLEAGGGIGVDATIKGASPAERDALLALERHVAFDPRHPKDQLRAAQRLPLPSLDGGTSAVCTAPKALVSGARAATFVPGAAASQRDSWGARKADGGEGFGLFLGRGLVAGAPLTVGRRTVTVLERGAEERVATVVLTRTDKGDHAFSPLFPSGNGVVRGAGGGFVVFVERPWQQPERAYLLELESGAIRRISFGAGDRFETAKVDEAGIELSVRTADVDACTKAGVARSVKLGWDAVKAAIAAAPATAPAPAAETGSFRRKQQLDSLR